MTAVLATFAATLAFAGRADDEAEPAGLGKPGFEIRFEPDRLEATSGNEGAVSLTLAPATGLQIDERALLRLELAVEPATGLELVRTRYARKHAADPRAQSPRFDLRYRATQPGVYTIAIELRFWLCRKHTCWPVHTTHQLDAIISAPAPPPDAGLPPPP